MQNISQPRKIEYIKRRDNQMWLRKYLRCRYSILDDSLRIIATSVTENPKDLEPTISEVIKLASDALRSTPIISLHACNNNMTLKLEVNSFHVDLT